jgi:hypothetical protein
MKRIVSAFLALAVSATLVFFAMSKLKHDQSVVHAQGGCSVATLSGGYGFNNPGFTTPSHSVKGTEIPFVVVGVLNFDGAGNLLSSPYTVAFKGTATTNAVTGTYSVNSDCTGSIAFTGGGAAGLNFNIAIVSGGSELFGIYTNPSFTASFDAKKQ